jgi:hypothetical protein
MIPRTPTQAPPTVGPAQDEPGRVFMIVLPNQVVLRLLVGLTVLTFGGMFFALEMAFARWAPWVPTQGMGALVTMVWGHHMLPVIRRQRPVGIGLARAFAFAALTAVIIAGAFYLVQP